MRRVSLTAFLLMLMLSTVLALATPVAAQTTTTGDEDSVLVRVRGNVDIPADESHGTIVLVNGDLDSKGAASTIVVVNGTATLDNATAESLVVISGTANLGAGTTINGDIQLVNSDLNRDPTATVTGEIRDEATDQFLTGFWIIGLLFLLGWAVLAILAALAIAAVAPTLARNSGRTITAEPTKTITAGLILWVIAPLLSMAAFATIVGIPTALTIWVVVLPAVGFVGLLVAGVRIGEYLTASGDGHGNGHPYLAATVGTVTLIVTGALPIVGPLLVTVAAFLGYGSLALHGWRAARTDHRRPIPAPTAAGAGP